MICKLVKERSGMTTGEDHFRAVLGLHLDPEFGSDYWLARQVALGWNVRDRVRSVGDLGLLGPTPAEDLRRHSIRAFIPKAFHGRLDRFVTGETAGTSGRPCATAYRDDEFESAFVTPFLRVAEGTGFPLEAAWLWIGPSGPHIIGKVVRELARRTGGIDPFSVDFDPRWVKKLDDRSFARNRYLRHVTDQALDVLAREDVGVLFATPPALAALAERMSDGQRESIRGVHYGGMSLDPVVVNDFRETFPNAVHLAGYGNTLVGVVMELTDGHRTAMDYYPLDDRMVIQVVRTDGDRPPMPVSYGDRGRVMFHRFDESALLVNVIERDEAERIPPGPDARAMGGTADGLRDPRPAAELGSQLRTGIY
jgi:hypothetical protein